MIAHVIRQDVDLKHLRLAAVRVVMYLFEFSNRTVVACRASLIALLLLLLLDLLIFVLVVL